MPRMQFDVNVANGVDIEDTNDVQLFLYCRFGGWKSTPFILTNQNYCCMLQLNYTIDICEICTKLLKSICSIDTQKLTSIMLAMY